MEQVLAALIEAIFAIIGAPNTSVRQCSLAMDVVSLHTVATPLKLW
jgi:hypothetical protein